MTEPKKHEPKKVLYVDRSGAVLQARTLSEPDAMGMVQLLVSFGGGRGMSVVEARESGAKAAGTWHHPDQPS
jgi:hypothetical protein